MNSHLFYQNIFSFFIVFLLMINLPFAQNSSNLIFLWKNEVPGFESKKNEPEQAKDWWVNTINNSSLTVLDALKEITTGGAVVVGSGGGFQNPAINSKGGDAALYLYSIGLTALVLKVGLFRQIKPLYLQQHPAQDIFRAMRLVTSVVTTYAVDPRQNWYEGIFSR